MRSANGLTGCCRFSNLVSHRDILTCDDAGSLTRCHRAFVSNSCHFFGTPLRSRPAAGAGIEWAPGLMTPELLDFTVQPSGSLGATACLRRPSAQAMCVHFDQC